MALDDLLDGPGPLYARIADQVRDDVLRGRLRPGDRLTSTTQYAVQLGINPATAARALGELVDEGTAEKRRGIGVFVREGARERLRAERARAYGPEVLDPALAEADLLGIDGDELLDHVRRHVEARAVSPTAPRGEAPRPAASSAVEQPTAGALLEDVVSP